jgi:N-glycosidase YbiA
VIDPVYFYTPQEPYGEFSNFSRHGIEMDQIWWSTVEHYFQAQKFADPAYREKIRLTATAKQAAALGRSRAVPLRPDWEDVKVEIMHRAVLKKFKTHPALRSLLLQTGVRPIVENAPGDYFWGCGQDGSGQNWLGKILEDVRKEITGEGVS